MMSAELEKPTVLVVDGDDGIRRLLRSCLACNGYNVLEAATGREGIDEVVRGRPNAVVLDSGLPDMNGLAVLRHLREWSQVPVLVVSDCDREHDKITALDNGANDYITKPFYTGEVMARLRVTQRYYAQPVSKTECFKSGHLSVDLVNREVAVSGEKIRLRPTEYSLLRFFVNHAGKVLTHQQILLAIWGSEKEENLNSMRVCISYLRARLNTDPTKPQLIVTEPGIGYRLVVDSGNN